MGASPSPAACVGHVGGPNGPFRAGLRGGVEVSIRAPGMAKRPGRIAAGKTHEMVAANDFMPTLAAIIGADPREQRSVTGAHGWKVRHCIQAIAGARSAGHRSGGRLGGPCGCFGRPKGVGTGRAADEAPCPHPT